MDLDSFLLQMQGHWYLSVLALALLFFAARGVGCWLLPRRGGEFVRLALGVVFLAWLYPWWWRTLPGWAGLVLLVPAARGVWDIPWRRLKTERRLYLALGIFGAATLGSALLPPFVWDEQVYQTGLWARAPEMLGGIDNPYSAYPLLPHFFLMWTRSWAGWSLPRLAVWLLSLVLAGKLYLETARRSKSTALGVVATACVMLAPAALILQQGFYAESFVALFAFAGFLAAEGADAKNVDRDELFRQLVSGVFAGACVAVKLTGVGAALMLAILASKRRRFQYFVLAAAVTALPFFLRPWLVFGNPFYPFGSAWWGGEKARAVEDVFRLLGDYGPGKMVGTLTGWFYVCVAEDRVFDGVWGTGVLALTILLLLSLYRRGKAAVVPFSALAAGYVFWAVTSPQSRFLYPLLFPLVLLLADDFPVFAAERRVRIAVLLLPVLGALVSWNGIYPRLRHHLTAWRMLPAARRDPGSFLVRATRDPGYFNALKCLGQIAPKDARVLLLCERRSLYVPRRTGHGSPLFQEARLTPVPRTADELWRGIKDFDYVLLGSTRDRMDHLKSYDRIEEILERQLSSLQRRGMIRVVPVPPQVVCQPVIEVVHEP